MKECTFKPELKTNQPDLSKSVISAVGGSQPKYEQLYSMAK